MIGTFDRCFQSSTKKFFWAYDFSLNCLDELKRLGYSVVAKKEKVSCILDADYGMIVDIRYGSDGGYIARGRASHLTEYVSIPFDEIILPKIVSSAEMRKFKTGATSIGEIKLNSLALLMGVYNALFPDADSFKEASFNVEWNGQSFTLGLCWLEMFLSIEQMRGIENSSQNFLQSFIEYYRIYVVHVADVKAYRYNKFLFGVALQYYPGNKPSFEDYAVPAKINGVLNVGEECIESSFNYDEIVSEQTFSFNISSVCLPKVLVEQIIYKVGCFIAFNKDRKEADSQDYHNEMCQEAREQEKLESREDTLQSDVWLEDPFDEPGWKWNID